MLRAGPLTAGDVAEEFEVSRPAISRHLRVLRSAGLITAETRGRQRIYTLETGPLDELEEWLAGLRRQWGGRLDALETEVRRTQRDRRGVKHPTTTPKEISA